MLADWLAGEQLSNPIRPDRKTCELLSGLKITNQETGPQLPGVAFSAEEGWEELNWRLAALLLAG